MTRKLVKYLDGEELVGELVSEDENVVVLDSRFGRITIDKTLIESCETVFNCEVESIGQYIDTPDGVYVKIAENHFRLVSGPHNSLIDVSSIREGTPTTHEQVFGVPAVPEVTE